MDERASDTRGGRFVMGLVVGGALGAGLALLLAPRAAAEIKARAVDSAKNLGNVVSGRYRDARHRVSDAVDGLTRRGQALRDDACDTVVHGAHEVEAGAQAVQRYATDAKTPVAL
jgi:gas vesicle protein